jgi:hypothetical protein
MYIPVSDIERKEFYHKRSSPGRTESDLSGTVILQSEHALFNNYGLESACSLYADWAIEMAEGCRINHGWTNMMDF